MDESNSLCLVQSYFKYNFNNLYKNLYKRSELNNL